MDQKLIALSQADLAKIQRRIEKLQSSAIRHKEFLERSSDNCWDYPDADEKYEHYMDLIEIAERREELLENIYENISQVVDDLTKLEKL